MLVRSLCCSLSSCAGNAGLRNRDGKSGWLPATFGATAEVCQLGRRVRSVSNLHLNLCRWPILCTLVLFVYASSVCANGLSSCFDLCFISWCFVLSHFTWASENCWWFSFSCTVSAFTPSVSFTYFITQCAVRVPCVISSCTFIFFKCWDYRQQNEFLCQGERSVFNGRLC